MINLQLLTSHSLFNFNSNYRVKMDSLQVCCGEFIRIILFVLNFIFWAAGGVILGVGIYVKVTTINKYSVDYCSEYSFL